MPRRLASITAFARRRPDERVRLLVQDETRLGLHLPSYRRLTGRGVKPHQVIAPLYEYYWLYATVEPVTGETFYLEMPWLNADAFTVFLAEVSKQYRDDLCVIVLDNAGAHTAARVVVPENVILVPLPAYSPELNPVERLWQDLKRRIDVFDGSIRRSLSALRDHVAELVRGYTPEQIASLTGYDYLVEAANAL